MPPVLQLKDDEGNFIDRRFIALKKCSYFRQDGKDCNALKGVVVKNNKQAGSCDTQCGTSTEGTMCKYYDCCKSKNVQQYCETCSNIETSTFAFNVVEIMRQYIVVQKFTGSKKMPLLVFNPVNQQPFTENDYKSFIKTFRGGIKSLVSEYEQAKISLLRKIFTVTNIGWGLFTLSLVLQKMSSPDDLEMKTLLDNINMFSNLAFTIDGIFALKDVVKKRKWATTGDKLKAVRLATYEAAVRMGGKFAYLDKLDKTIMGMGIINTLKNNVLKLKNKDTIKFQRFNKTLNDSIIKRQKEVRSQMKITNKTLLEKGFFDQFD